MTKTIRCYAIDFEHCRICGYRQIEVNLASARSTRWRNIRQKATAGNWNFPFFVKNDLD